MIRANNIIKCNFFFMGIFLTLGAFMFNIFGMDIAVVNIFIAIILILQSFKGNLYIKRYKIPLILLFIEMIISTLGNYQLLGLDWINESIRGVIKFTVFLLPFVIIFSDYELLIYRKKFFAGLKISCYIQVLWEFFQVFLWNIKGISLNQIVFGEILNIKINHTWTFISDGRFRPSGVSWEPANLALSLLIGYSLSKNKYSKILFLIGLILSTSRTGIIVGLIMVVFDIISFLKNLKKSYILKLKYNSILICLVFIIIGLIAYILFNKFINNSLVRITSGIQITFDKIHQISKGTDSSSNMHLFYYKEALNIFRYSDIFQILFGFGTFCAGFPYSKFLNIYTWIKTWNPESDFITLLIGNGIVGISLYYIAIFKCIKYNIKNLKVLKMLFSILIGGFLYIYIRNSWPVIILIMLLVKTENNDI